MRRRILVPQLALDHTVSVTSPVTRSFAGARAIPRTGARAVASTIASAVLAGDDRDCRVLRQRRVRAQSRERGHREQRRLAEQ